ncbi:MAG: 5'/3'-nucleotidase SurE [Acidobacteria bacterium OLB17]|nr:MAG: 5'/3'-nucleotidase SurE [Acidobacteria bacterium OLB17]MCZ2391250.1 5'/3'-nucleotidase SurE [Acidobacteriota bacterium]
MARPRILITNDDGIHADGIKALEAALSPLGEVFVVAPEAEMSGASHSLTLARPLRIRRIDDHHWTVDGTPTDCVVMALNKILPPDMPPDICCSGINHGPNLGDDASYSGTVAGAMEATILGVPGIAFSLAVSRDHDFRDSANVAASVTERALSIGLPSGTLLNVNIPRGVPVGTRITTQGFKTARPVISEHTDPRGKLYYWIGEVRNGYRAEGGTDFEAIDAGLVSVTPMRADLTDHSSLDLLNDWNT